MRGNLVNPHGLPIEKVANERMLRVNEQTTDKDVPKAWRTLAKGLCANSSLWCHQVFLTRQAHSILGWSEPGHSGRQTRISW